jgi:hypothetical protein
LGVLLCAGTGADGASLPPAARERAAETTALARKLVLERISAIAEAQHCRQAFGKQNIDLARIRATVYRTRFYSALGEEGHLKFSQVVGKLSSPDETIRTLARDLAADAFVLGYQDGRRYIRTRNVILNRGYFEQPGVPDGTSRPTTPEEKQSLLLHEILHVALDVDDEHLSQRDLCPLRLLAFCPRTPAPVPSD